MARINFMQQNLSIAGIFFPFLSGAKLPSNTSKDTIFLTMAGRVPSGGIEHVHTGR